MVENQKFDLPGIDIFHGSTDLRTHDFIHILLGRGVMIKDEAFVIGFTMGNANRVTTTEERLFSLITQYFYPRGIGLLPRICRCIGMRCGLLMSLIVSLWQK